MKLLSALAVTAVSAGRIKRDLSDDGWTYIEPAVAAAVSGTVEANWYRIGGDGTYNDAKHYCEVDWDGFLPASIEHGVLHFYANMLGVGNNFWTDFKRYISANVLPFAYYPSNPFHAMRSCDPISQNGTEYCYIAHNMMNSTRYCFIENGCEDRTQTGIWKTLCLKNSDPPATTTAAPTTTTESPYTWSYIDPMTPGYTTEINANYYLVGPTATADEAHAFCAQNGGFVTTTKKDDAMNFLKDLGATDSFWNGYKRIASNWEFFQHNDPAIQGTRDTYFWRFSACHAPNPDQSTTVCSRSYNDRWGWCQAEENCDRKEAQTFCLKTDTPPTQHTIALIKTIGKGVFL